MSWWDLPGQVGHIIGDPPADIGTDSLKRASALPGRPRPTLPELLGALTQAITRSSVLLENPARAARSHVVARTSKGEIAADVLADERLVSELEKGLQEIAAVYEERWERKPRLAEILGTFAFALRPPSDYCRDTDGLELIELIVRRSP